MRHGKAEVAVPGTDDTDRKLTKKGREDIAAAGRWMAAQDLRFDLIAASPLARAQETAAIVAESLGEKDLLVTWKVLVSAGNPETVCRLAGRHKDMQAILLVSHEPLLSALISHIISGDENAAIVMSKGALAKIRNFSYRMNPSGELHWLVTAPQMAGIK